MASPEKRLGDAARVLGDLETKQSPAGSSPSSSSAQVITQASRASFSTRVRRRNRMITSCLECRRRKLKCDKSHPCVNCTVGHRDCVFLAPALDQASQLRLNEIKEKASSLELLLETDVARTSGSSTSVLGMKFRPDSTKRALQLQEDETDLAPSPLVAVDAVYDDDADDDDILDLGVQIGKMRITERIGGFFRPKVAEELEAALRSPASQASSDPSQPLNSLRAQNLPYLMPGPAYIAPTAGFFFGQTTHVSGLLDHLPTRQATDRLIQAYFMSVHPVAKILHRPSFEAEYDSFWNQVSQNIEPPASVQAIVFATMFSGLVSIDDEVILNMFGVHKDRFVDTIRVGTESALCRAHFLRTTKVETLQAFVMFLIPLCRAEISRMHSVLVGSAIRLAECIGLHRDGEVYGMNPLETHVRRLIWHQLCFLDIRTCEAQGPRPGVRKDDFDTLFPLNLDDADVHTAPDQQVERHRWTDTTLVRMRFEINEFMRFLWTERALLQRRESTLTFVLTRMEAFRREINEKYDRLFDDRIPIQKHARLLKSLLLSRLHVMVLAPYHTAPATVMPPKLRQVLVGNAISLLESAILIETLPELHPWAFWSGAYQQSHAAFLLLMDVTYFKPAESTNINRDRIWRCLDYVFETDPAEPTDIKALKILTEVQEKTKEYQQFRKMRAPTAMVKHVEESPRRRVDGSLIVEADGISPPNNRRESLVNEAPAIIGKAPIPIVFMESPTSGRVFATTTQQPFDLEVGGPGNVGIAPLISQLPQRDGGDFSMPDIDWDVFDELYPVGQDFSVVPSGFKPLSD